MEHSTVISTSDNKENEPIVDEYSVDPGAPTCTCTSPEPDNTENQNSEKHDKISHELLEIVDDMCVRLGENSPSYFSGVCIFIHRYKALQQRTISTPCIASALHMFGSEGELLSGSILSYVYATFAIGLTRRNRGKLIPVQVTATSRHRKGITRIQAHSSRSSTTAEQKYTTQGGSLFYEEIQAKRATQPILKH